MGAAQTHKNSSAQRASLTSSIQFIEVQTKEDVKHVGLREEGLTKYRKGHLIAFFKAGLASLAHKVSDARHSKTLLQSQPGGSVATATHTKARAL